MKMKLSRKEEKSLLTSLFNRASNFKRRTSRIGRILEEVGSRSGAFLLMNNRFMAFCIMLQIQMQGTHRLEKKW